jgi:hypothetical protein
MMADEDDVRTKARGDLFPWLDCRRTWSFLRSGHAMFLRAQTLLILLMVLKIYVQKDYDHSQCLDLRSSTAHYQTSGPET